MPTRRYWGCFDGGWANGPSLESGRIRGIIGSSVYEDRDRIAEKVEQLLRDALLRELPLLMSAVNWGEVFYTEWKYRGEVNAREAEAKLRELPIMVLPADLDRATRAAALKQKHSLGYADAFAAELAIERGAWLVTADPEFLKLGKALSVYSLPRYEK
jgi:predicted nucleic acid-binding protein